MSHSAPKSISQSAKAPAVIFFDSTVTFPDRRARISYECDSGSTILWSERSLDLSPLVHLTTLEVASGGGKTTLMNLIYGFLQGAPSGPGVQFLPKSNIRQNVAHIPQRPNTVRHWKVRNLLPADSPFVACMFEEKIEDFYGKTLSAFSGGQVARIFVASALHRLERGGSRINYLLLDEAFEGIDAHLLFKSLNGIASVWSHRNPSKHLFILLVTHLEMTSIMKEFDASYIDIDRIILTKHASDFADQLETIRISLKKLPRGVL